MNKREMVRVKVKGRHVVLSLVCLVLGFLISFSYQFTREGREEGKLTDFQWEREYEFRNRLAEQQRRNHELHKELLDKQEKVRKMEEELAKQQGIYFNLVEDVEKYRMFVGEIKVKGPGIVVTLADASYVPSEENVNNYIVHERHIFNVVNELLISGATAVSINGQRLSHNSYIYCNGPVITVDGNQYPAPFVISAIGDPDVLNASLNITGGVVDQLLNENITVKIETKSEIIMEPLLKTGDELQ
jgi:uncharacterized protein YlxW (UPF0749 family)